MIAAGSLVAILLLWSDDRYHFLWKALLALAFCASVVGTVDGAVALRSAAFRRRAWQALAWSLVPLALTLFMRFFLWELRAP